MSLNLIIQRIKGRSLPLAESRPAKDPAKNLNCSRFEVDGWVISRFVAEKMLPLVGVHPFPLQELMLMTSAVCRLRPPVIFEWGTNIGKSARIFYETCRYFQIPSPIHSVDLPDEVMHGEHPKEKRGVLVKGLPGVFLHQGDGLTTALRIWAELGKPRNPMFFVDGDHNYESVKKEMEGIMAAVPEPLILLHDTFYQSTESGYNTGPHRAVNEALTNHSGKFQMIHSGLSLPGMTLLAGMAKPLP